MMRLTITIFVAFLCVNINAQETPRLPLDLPVSFSGTYGELRHNHFHAGYDFRVGGKIGDPIHAILDGYVSRVTVSRNGYGNGLYVTYNNGVTVVHGHMSSFSKQISDRVRSAQYENESDEIDICFQEDEIPVRQGEVIGRVGNTGSSGGPHLHFEFRRGDGSGTYDFIRDGYFDMNDKVSPVISRVNFYAFPDSVMSAESVRIAQLRSPQKKGDVLKLPSLSYLAIDATDRQSNTPGKLAISRYEVLFDGKSIFQFEVGDISFDEDPFIKSLIEYKESYRRGADMVKSYVEPLNILSKNHIVSTNSGLIRLDDEHIHTVTVKVSDISGNSTSWNLNVQRDNDLKVGFTADCDSSIVMNWFTPNIVETEYFSYAVPAASFYNSIRFTYKKIADADAQSGRYSPLLEIGNVEIPMNKSGILRMNASQVPASIRDKAYIASMSNMGRTSYVGGTWEGDDMKVKARFGTYFVTVDVTAPELSIVTSGKSKINKRGEVSAYIRDRESGIASYRIEIDGKWVLSKFTGSRLSVNLAAEGISKGTHAVHIVVMDKVGNTSEAKFDVEFK